MLSIDHGAALRERPGCMIQGKKAVGVRLVLILINSSPSNVKSHVFSVTAKFLVVC